MDILNRITIKVKAKKIKVERPRGKLVRNFKHLNLNFQLITDEETGQKKLKVDAWYKMRFLYAHFPINASITGRNKSIEIRNFLGEKKVRKVDMLEGVTVVPSEKSLPDEIISTDVRSEKETTLWKNNRLTEAPRLQIFLVYIMLNRLDVKGNHQISFNFDASKRQEPVFNHLVDSGSLSDNCIDTFTGCALQDMCMGECTRAEVEP
ncbi:60S ribosomal protein L9 [Capsicum annuum]|uniref:60S ribosomal protein L9 n=1 Tax=Capsicum annuum TaxID=4072 RepID=A0A2G3AI50_CAPAN|nr:60S ribosomal protein L9 [Capsicum annuum]